MTGSPQSIELPRFVVAALTGSGVARMRIASSTSKLDSNVNELSQTSKSGNV